MEELRIGNSRYQAIFLTLISSGFVATGVWMLFRPGRNDAWISWVTIVFFGAGILGGIWMLIDTRPRLIIDEQGIYDRTLGVGRIPWSDITDAYLQSIQGNDFISLELRNEEDYLHQLSSVKRAMTKANATLGFTAITLNLSGIAADSHQILELILKQSAAHRDA